MAAKKMLDLRYNEMWKVWNDTAGENDDFSDTVQTSKHDLTLSWKQLSVTVEKKTPKWFGTSEILHKRILDNVSGKVESGHLLGIIGPSGSGKTTLMATISHRTKGNFQGELLLNSRPVSEDVMIKLSGFVAQEDVSFVQLTVLEQLKFMARLKMDRSSTKQLIEDRIRHLTSNLGLNEVLNTRVCFLSGGERKKLALAVQLINDPPILFCDEITTGLDSYSAAYVIYMLRRIARSGKIVICTIHQPSSGLFDQFQEVVLLTDGRLAYHGPVSLVNDMLKMYDYTCPATYNKAEYILSILSSDAELDKLNVNDMCVKSLAAVQAKNLSDTLSTDIHLEYERNLRLKKGNWFTQVLLLFNRSATCFVRNYNEKLLDLGIYMFFGLTISTPYANLQIDKNTVQNLENFWINFVYCSVFLFGYTGLNVYQVNISIIHREVSNKLYSPSAYYVSELILSIIWILIIVVHLCILVFWIVGINWVFMQLWAFFIVAIASFSFGTLWSSYCNDVEVTEVFYTTFLEISSAFNGAFLSLKSLPAMLSVLKYLTLFFYGCEIMSSLFWINMKSIPNTDADHDLDSGETVLNDMGFYSKNIHFDLMILLSFSLFSFTLGYVGVFKKTGAQAVY